MGVLIVLGALAIIALGFTGWYPILMVAIVIVSVLLPLSLRV